VRNKALPFQSTSSSVARSDFTWGPGRPWWAIDWPEAEQHFTDGVKRYTSINIASDSRHIRLTDNALFDFPFLLVQQPGRWRISNAEQQHLRQYLLRGGFMMVDDFHGPQQWKIFNDGVAYMTSRIV